ncbi:hypothetical protein Sviol_29370 [Streptomyces violascens]|uniref:Phosphatase n=1 Tax=Streptomyces violascens TaxID=67381 RepID=A0ABQ3QMU5_9ACTN|nr:hypothetical protein Sviol_29370 [Streptomyces violascens]
MGNGRQDTGKRPAHLVWDWNGTLLDDNVAIIEATNAAFAELGLEPITLERYRDLYCVPIPRFYQRLIGRLPTDAEWLVMDAAFHQHTGRGRNACGLTEGAAELLAARRAAGLSQSAALPWRRTNTWCRSCGGTGSPAISYGSTGAPGPRTAARREHMVRHLTALRGGGPRDIRRAHRVGIGDAVDDAVAAAAVGAKAVLYTGGSHSRASLAAAGGAGRRLPRRGGDRRGGTGRLSGVTSPEPSPRSTVRNSRIQREWSGQARAETRVPSTTVSASWNVAPAVCMSSSRAG